MKDFIRPLAPVLDPIIVPFAAVAGFFLKFVRRFGLERLPLTRAGLRAVGLLPVYHHFYEPVVYPSDLRFPLTRERALAGLDLNTAEQLALLEQFHYAEELARLPQTDPGGLRYYYQNGAFESGDAEYLYNMVRHFKPARIIEIGSGFSTRITREAIAANKTENAAYACRHICVEPYRHMWLEQVGAEIIRKRVEECDITIFDELGKNDIFIIDSSHMIRPQGDVLFEYLEILGRLRSGVVVHVHDIYTPRDYPERLVLEEQKLWNEQYLLEAFLCCNPSFRVIGAVNYLWHNHREAVSRKCPVLAQKPDREPGSFWFARS